MACSGDNRWWRNTFLIDRLAVKELQAAPFFALKADKAGAVVLVLKADLVACHRGILAKDWYAPAQVIVNYNLF